MKSNIVLTGFMGLGNQSREAVGPTAGMDLSIPYSYRGSGWDEDSGDLLPVWEGRSGEEQLSFARQLMSTAVSLPLGEGLSLTGII